MLFFIYFHIMYYNVELKWWNRVDKWFIYCT